MSMIEFGSKKLAIRILLGLTILLLAVPSSVLAGYVGDNIAISSTAYDQQNPHTIYLQDKNLWLVVWEDWRNLTTTGADIYGQFIDAAGNNCGQEFVISNAASNQTVPRAAYRFDAEDPSRSKVVVVWQDARPNYVYYNEIDTIDETNNCTFLLGAEKPLGFNPLRQYSGSTLSTEMITGEQIGTGNGTNVTFSGTLFYKPVYPGSVIVTDGTQTCSDDGAGNLSGAGCTGTITYSGGGAGSLSVTFTSAPPNRRPVTVRYQYQVSVAGQRIGTGSGTSKTFSAVLNSPLMQTASAGRVTITDGTQTCLDDGSGTFVNGTGCTGGSINYTSGSVSATFDSPTALDATVTADYTFLPSVTGERIGTGSGSSDAFAGVLSHGLVVPGSVTVRAGAEVLVDNGFGNFVGGPGASGSINYNSGSISVRFSANPANGQAITVAYTYSNTSNDIAGDTVGFGNGQDKRFRKTLTVAPVLPGSLGISVAGTLTLRDDGSGRLIFNAGPPTISTSEQIGTGDGFLKTFVQKVSEAPVRQQTVTVNSGAQTCTDSGLRSGCTVTVDYMTGLVTVFFDTPPSGPVTVNYDYYPGVIDYESGVVSVVFDSAPAIGSEITADYTYRAFPPGKMAVGDSLVSRQIPRIAYEASGDRFWVVWKETRNVLHRISELCFASSVGAITGWDFDDSDFIGYVRLSGSDLSEQNSILNVAGADIVRNTDTTTQREVSSQFLALRETREYESFQLATHPDVACDDTSTQCMIVWEGVREKQTLTCNCEDKNNNSICDLADVVTSGLQSAPFDDGQVHIYGIASNYVHQGTISSMKLDSALNDEAHYPSVGFDPITKRFLTVWEDMRGGSNTKIYGRLTLSGGGLYNQDFIVSCEDTDNSGNDNCLAGIDANVLNSKQTRPFVSYDPVNQRFFVIWQDARNSSVSLENLDIYGQKVDAEGSLRGSNYAVFVQPFNQWNPTIAYNDATNQFLAVWKDARHTDNSTCSMTGGVGTGAKPCGADVYGQRLTLGQPSLTLLNLDDTALTPAVLNQFENPTELGQFSTQAFKVRNTGDTVLAIDYIDETCRGKYSPPDPFQPFQFDGLPEELTARDGTTLNLSPSEEVTLTVRFTPLRGGSYNRCFVIESDGGNPQVNVSALAVEPNISLDSPAAPFDFGNVFIGSFGEQTFVIRNTGTARLRIASLDNPLTPFTIQSDGCSGLTDGIAPGSTCEISVRFTPTGVGAFNSQFGIHSNDPDVPVLTVGLAGTGVGAQDITVTPLTVDFGSVQVGQTGQKTITVKNDGTAALTITSVSSPLPPFSIVSNNCPVGPATLSVGMSCQIVVMFAPSVSGGTSSGITIQSNDPDEGAVAVVLSGTGIVTPDITANPVAVNFPSTIVGATSESIVTIGNAGTTDLLITGLINPGSSFSIIGSDCIGALPPASTCTVSVAFNPTSGGFKSSSFGIVSNDPDSPTFLVPLTGTGSIAADINIVPSVLNFGGHLAGTKTDMNLTISNTGTSQLNIVSVSSPVPPFSIVSNQCSGVPVSPGGSCQITVRFAPPGVSNFSSVITIASNASDPAKKSIDVLISGAGLGNPVIDLAPAPVDFLKVHLGAIARRVLDISNIGGSDLKINSVSKPSAPFSIEQDDCTGVTLLPNSFCKVSIVFNPTFTGSFDPYFMTVSSTDPAHPSIKLTIKGEAVDADELIFADVPPAYWASSQIEVVYNNGITNGCFFDGVTRLYCPESLVSREGMAAFIIRALGEPASFAAYNAYFDDIVNDGFAGYINRMSELGITMGCGPRAYCPFSNISRQQMAVFIVRALGEQPSVVAYNAYFDDIANDGYAGYINRINELGVTQGCGTRAYCPFNATTRAEMAVFLFKAFIELQGLLY